MAVALDASRAYAKTFLCHSGAIAIESLPTPVKATFLDSIISASENSRVTKAKRMAVALNKH